MVPRLGFEPRYTAPEAVVLPLDDLGMTSERIPSRLCPVKERPRSTPRPGRSFTEPSGFGIETKRHPRKNSLPP